MRLLTFFIFILSFEALAHEKFITRIHSVSWAGLAEEAHLIKFQNARICFFFHTNKLEGIAPGELVEVEVTKKHELVFIQKLRDENQLSINSPFIVDIDYIPSIIASLDDAQKMIKQFRKDFLTKSGSHDRAHVWAFEEYKRSHTFSMKAFLLVSDDYIRKHRYKWWFHVAPLVSININNKRTEKILDPFHSSKPLSVAKWSNFLLPKNSPCREINTFSHYSLQTSRRDCYVMKENMYFRGPEDLIKLEFVGITRVNFFKEEIKNSLKMAFGIVER
jgi:hypothetical protein